MSLSINHVSLYKAQRAHNLSYTYRYTGGLTGVLQRDAVWCSVVQCVAVCCSMVQCGTGGAVWCGVVRCGSVVQCVVV